LQVDEDDSGFQEVLQLCQAPEAWFVSSTAGTGLQLRPAEYSQVFGGQQNLAVTQK